MTTDKTAATLATAKHGGCVQLGDGLTIEKRAREMLAAQFDTNGPCAKTAMTAQDTYTMGAVRALINALSSQPSPGGQDVVSDEMVQAACKVWAETPGQGEDWMRTALQAALAARQPVGQIVGWQHCGENHEHMVISDRTKQALKEGESERGIQKIEAAYSIPLVRQPVCATVKDSLTVGGGQAVGEPVAVRVTPGMRAAFRRAYREGGLWADRLDTALDAMMRAAPPAQAVDLAEFKALYRAYVRLLESGRDRIIDLGGTCDPVDVMEANDVDLQAARRVMDSQAVGHG
ncbi:TPA: hypothetical protein UOA81_000849 [Stenotrophomonas maltophilia]|nr:hypothetical protein [Stenotrophomonas maltophilia]